MTTEAASMPDTKVEKALANRPSVFRQLVSRPSGLFSMLVIGFLLVLFAFGPLIAPYGAAEQDIKHRLEGPSRDHLLGTDHLGRDILSRLIVGTRVALGVAVPSVLAALAAGMILGSMMGGKR